MKHAHITQRACSAARAGPACRALTLALALAAPAVVHAEPVSAPTAPNAPLVDKPATTTDAAPTPFGAGAAVGLQRLKGSRGGASTSTQVDIGGTVKDASATNVATGNNAIRDGSFSNAVGLNTVIQNSGANVLIQNSMTVNVQFK